ncbi:unnamed protein product [Mycena citricolor]|uniref:Ribosomal lysine N-methyltransferase 4 n=1 Tax=Mycena citricolor TaxID=2018698 RepID=A0AAD2GWR7_9AGAR|nr:unnamed protein product [Mycena citricolor]
MSDVADLVKWFKTSGGSLDEEFVGFTVFPGCGRGAVALKDVPEGHVLFRIPRSILLSPENSELPGRVGLAHWKERKMHIGWAGLILCMMWETAQGSSSRWSGYLDSLPSTFDTPMFWNDEDLRELQGTTVVAKLGRDDAERDFTEKLLPLVQSRPDIFPVDTIYTYYTLEIYHIMGSRILSRSFDVENDEPDEDGDADDTEEEHVAANTSVGSAMDVDGPAEAEPAADTNEPEDDLENIEEEEEPANVAMVPMADMLNAQFGSENAKLFYEKEELRMVSTKPIKAGDQIWNTYGDLPNSELLRRYGHVDMLPLPNGDVGNPGDVVEIPADIAVQVLGLDAGTTKERIDWWLEQGGDDVLVLESDLEIPLALVALIRLLRLTPGEWEQAVEKDKVPKPKIDGEVLPIVKTVFESRLSQYPTTLEADIAMLENPSIAVNKKYALVVRVGEKKILREVIAKLGALVEAESASQTKKRKVRPDDDSERKSKSRRR